MSKSDPAHDWTDEEIQRIADELRKQYSEATAEMMDKQANFLKEYEFEKSRLDKALKAGDISKDQYKQYMRDMTIQRKWFSDMVDSLADGAYNADVRAMDTVNDAMPRVYAENHNYAAYEVERGYNISTSFTLVDENTVRRLVVDEPDLLPQKIVDKAKDIEWNQKKFNSAILQGIIQGESIPDIATRITSVMNMNYRAAYRNARTACTAAENAGRLDSYYRMRRYGLPVAKEWSATLDHRTRDTHRLEDRHVCDLDEAFPETGLMFPGDPSTNDPGEVMNCRCRLVANFEFIDYSDEVRFSRLGNQSYATWKKGKSGKAKSRKGKR